MGIDKLFGGLFGGGSPKTSTKATTTTEAEATKAKTSRAALYETAGGVSGSELDPTQVKKRETLFGN